MEEKIEKIIRDTFPQGNHGDYIEYISEDMSDVVIDGNFDLEMLKEDLMKLITK